MKIRDKINDILFIHPDPELQASNDYQQQAITTFRNSLTDEQDEAYLLLERAYSDNFELSSRLLFLAGISDSSQ